MLSESAFLYPCFLNQEARMKTGRAMPQAAIPLAPSSLASFSAASSKAVPMPLFWKFPRPCLCPWTQMQRTK